MGRDDGTGVGWLEGTGVGRDDGNGDDNCDGDFIDISGAGSFQVPRLECRSHSFSREAVGVDIASRFFDSSTASAER